MSHAARLFAFRIALALVVLTPAPAVAGNGTSARVISGELLATVFPGAERAGPFAGSPPAADVYADGAVVGYLLSTLSVVGSTGYSGKPLDVLVGIDRRAVVTGAALVQHTEPILVIGITEDQLRRYVGGFAGLDLGLRIEAGDDRSTPDAISGASVSSAVIRDSIVRAGRAVARSRGLLGGSASGERLDRETVEPVSWDTLVDDGSVAAARFVKSGDDGDDKETLLLELYAALLTPPRIGESLLGKLTYTELVAGLGADDHAILIAANGLFSIKGTGFARSGRFERTQIVQGERTLPLTTDGYANVAMLKAEGAPQFREIGAFTLRGASGFDPLQPWRVDVRASTATDGAPEVLSLVYSLPDRYRKPPAAASLEHGAAGKDDGDVAGEPLWQRIWSERSGRIAGVIAMLLVLTAALVFQASLVQRPRFYRAARLSFLAVILVWLGWIAGGQLSVVNVLTFAHALMSDFNWDFFLIEPLIFILWSYVAVALLFLGRGVYCGWLCPFGALQELLGEAARRLHVPQVKVPFAVHERLWPIKYILFLGIFAVSLSSTTTAFIGAEVEPFKTAILMHFARAWPFVLYAVTLLAIGLFIDRFFCRYLCPLGAALAIPARLRMFEWLKRRPQCGRECQICFGRCPVQAIHPEGQINPNECIHCLQCQAIYLDDETCPPLVAKRKRRERRESLSAGKSVAMEER